MGKPLDLRAVAVPGDPGGAGVHHVLDAGHRQRRLRHVGRQHDPPRHTPPRAPPDPLLLGRGQPGVQRQQLGVAQHAALPVSGDRAGQRLGGLPDVPLARQEDQHVTGALGGQLAARIDDRLGLVALLGAGVVGIHQRAGSAPRPGKSGRTPR